MGERPKALLLASVASMIGQFNMQNIQLLLKEGYAVEVAANFKCGNTVSKQGVQEIKNQLMHMGVKIWTLSIPRELSHVTDIWKAYRQVKCLCANNHYQILHCQSPIGGVIARAAAKDFRNKGTTVIYTAHGFHFYRGSPTKNWLFFYPIEWFCSWWTDILVTINREDYEFAKKHLHARKICYVPGIGIDRKKFCFGQIDIEQIRKKLGVNEKNIMLLSVGELSIRKDHQTVIRAVKKMGNPDIRYFICGIGAQEKELRDLIRRLELEKQVTLLGYRTDISQLCQAADLFVLSSKQEGLPAALMEAIACKTAVVCSDIRGSRELVKDPECMFPVSNVDALTACLKRKLAAKTRQQLLKSMESTVEENYKNLDAYDAVRVAEKMVSIYRSASGIFNGEQ